MHSIDLNTARTCFDEHWSPRIVADVNGQHVQIAKVSGAFDWHSHADADELFLVLDGSFTMEFRDHSVKLSEGQILVVPRGVEHRPVAEAECAVMLVEPAGLVNTGDGEQTDRSTTGHWLVDPLPKRSRP